MFNIINPIADFFGDPKIVILVICIIWDFIWK